MRKKISQSLFLKSRQMLTIYNHLNNNQTNMSSSQDKSESIFFSDEQEQNFKIDEIKMDYQENNIGNLFNESRASQQEACILQDDSKNQCEANMNTQLEASNMSLVKSFNIIIKDHLQNKIDGCSDFIPEETGKQAKLRTKPRASDQNLCKRYHTVANKCLREMNLYKHISPHVKKIHKRSFFIFVLIICKKANRFGQFVEAYQEKIIDMICQISQENKMYKIGSKYQKKNKMLIESFYNSMDAVACFENEDVEGALKCLFDWKKMKRLSRIDEALQQVEDFGLKTQIL